MKKQSVAVLENKILTRIQRTLKELNKHKGLTRIKTLKTSVNKIYNIADELEDLEFDYAKIYDDYNGQMFIGTIVTTYLEGRADEDDPYSISGLNTFMKEDLKKTKRFIAKRKKERL